MSRRRRHHTSWMTPWRWLVTCFNGTNPNPILRSKYQRISGMFSQSKKKKKEANYASSCLENFLQIFSNFLSVPINRYFFLYFIKDKASDDDKDKTSVKYIAKITRFWLQPTPSKGTVETRQETQRCYENIYQRWLAKTCYIHTFNFIAPFTSPFFINEKIYSYVFFPIRISLKTPSLSRTEYDDKNGQPSPFRMAQERGDYDPLSDILLHGDFVKNILAKEKDKVGQRPLFTWDLKRHIQFRSIYFICSYMQYLEKCRNSNEDGITPFSAQLCISYQKVLCIAFGFILTK